MPKSIDIINTLEEELKWLRFFYNHASYAMGPADGDIYLMIKEDYLETGGTLPKEYQEPIEE